MDGARVCCQSRLYLNLLKVWFLQAPIFCQLNMWSVCVCVFACACTCVGSTDHRAMLVVQDTVWPFGIILSWKANLYLYISVTAMGEVPLQIFEVSSRHPSYCSSCKALGFSLWVLIPLATMSSQGLLFLPSLPFLFFSLSLLLILTKLGWKQPVKSTFQPEYFIALDFSHHIK